MSFNYLVTTHDYCRAMEFAQDNMCKKGSFSCPNGRFEFTMELPIKLDQENLDHYNKMPDFSVRKL